MTHQIIKTKDYLVIAENTKPEKGDYGLGYNKGIKDIIEPGHYVFKHDDSPVAKLDTACTGSKKIIAHLPLGDSPILEVVALLPPLQQEDDVEGLAEKLSIEYSVYETAQDDVYQGIIVGYNKAKEKYKYTEEEVRFIIMKSFLLGVDRGQYSKEREDEIIQSLSQPKIPTGFECEIEKQFEYRKPTADNVTGFTSLPYFIGEKIKTTTNPQGQTVLLGKYIFE
jgi:hypothetical protein